MYLFTSIFHHTKNEHCIKIVLHIMHCTVQEIIGTFINVMVCLAKSCLGIPLGNCRFGSGILMTINLKLRIIYSGIRVDIGSYKSAFDHLG